MTTIRDLPEETLSLIFKQLDLCVCQKVCRSWYRTAHLMFLNNINLKGAYKIDKFITSIDSNPDPQYLGSVKKICLSDTSDYQLDKTKIQKLLLRFPNLKQVQFCECLTFLENFNDKVCLEFLKSCPKLESFETDFSLQDRKRLFTLLLNIRLVLTKLPLYIVKSVPGYNSITQYIASFPRLKSLFTLKIPVNTFREFLPVFTQLPFLTRFIMNGAAAEQEYFAEIYMASKPQKEREELIKRLSEFKMLHWIMMDSFCLNAVKFIAKYMKGLTSVDIRACLDKTRANIPQSLFFHTALDLITSVNNSLLSLTMRPKVLQECYPLMVQRIFQQVTMQKRILRLRIYDYMNKPELAFLETEWFPESTDRNVWVKFSHHYSLLQIAQYLSVTPLDNIDEFKLEIDERRELQGAESNIETLDMLLKGLQSVKEVSIELPASFVDIKQVDETVYELAQLETLTIHAIEDMAIQSLLDRFGMAYPRLKNLSIFYNCGTWKQYLGEFQLELGIYTLDSLAVDITPVCEKTRTNISEQFAEEGFFVAEVECLENSKRYLYKVSFDELDTVELLDTELKQYTRGKDYIRLRITTMSLKQVTFCRFALSDAPKDYMKVPEEREEYTVMLE